MKKLIFIFCTIGCFAQPKPQSEEDFYKIVTIPIPQDIKLEVGGLAVIPDGRLAACTRSGDVWMISNPYMVNGTLPKFSKFAYGLHEPLGLAYINQKLWATQRGEVTILDDTDGNGIADSYEAFYKFPLSGNYHQYSYGPVPMANGDMLFTLNVDWVGKGASLSKWRGWMLKINPEGKMTPFATGLRSPAGFNVNSNNDIFYGENQGDWVGSGRVTHLELGDMAGNPAGLVWSGEADSPTQLKPADVPDTGEPLYDVAKTTKGIKPPAVWFPHTLMGISTSDIIEDQTGGTFGPFAGQYFVGDQGHSKVMRMSLEKIKGVYQGACFPFREGFQSGILRMRWGIDGSMFVGQTSRGWASTGKDPYGLQRLEWTGKTPFEIKTIKSSSDGFLIEFTEDIDKSTDASDLAIKSFNYKYHHTYGSPVINTKQMPIKAMLVDSRSFRVALDSIRLGYIYEFKLDGIKSATGKPLLHDVGYFTLNVINDEILAIDRLKYAVKPKMDHQNHSMAVTSNTKMEPTAKRVNIMPEKWNNSVDQTIVLSTKPGLKFNLNNIKVKAGNKVKFVFNNNDDMLHNVLILKPGTVTKVGEAAFNLGTEGESKAYVPDLSDVIAHTGLLQPESSETIYFEVPTIPGDYTFVCTFPGHYTLMQGILKVTK